MKHQFHSFEDYQIGQKGETFTRTINEADIVGYACLAADYNLLHMDRHATANNVYGGRIAHGLLGTAVAAGMLSLTAPHILGRGVPGAYLWSIDVDYLNAVKLGDTIKTQWSIIEKADDPAHEGYGLVKTAFQIPTQDGVAPYQGTIITLVPKHSTGDTRLQLKPATPWQTKELTIDPSKVKCMEDYPVGEGAESEGRTITEADVVNFAGLSGDYDPRYVDAQYAKNTQFGGRIAHGLLVFVIGFVLWSNDWDAYRQPKLAIGGHLNDNMTFLAPVKIGDTIRCRYKVLNSRVSKSRPEAGLITYGFQIVNQKDEVVQEGSTVFMRPTREGFKQQKAVYH